MTDTQNNQQPTTLPETIRPMREQLPALLEKNLPKMERQKAAALELLNSITEVTTKEEAEDVIAKLAGVRDVYGSNKKMRMEMTGITDAFKDIMMEYERDFDNAATAKSLYNEKRKLVEAFQQAEHDRIKSEQAKAAKQKELENHKVDLKSRMLENLSKMLVDGVKRVDAGSKEWFDATTLETWDKRSEAYKSNKPKLKQTDYDACFQNYLFPASNEEKLLPAGDFKVLADEVKAQETYDKWNDAFVEAVSPIINAWRAKIPDLKEQMIEVEELRKRDAEAATKLQEAQKAEAEAQAKQRQEQLDAAAAEQQQKIQEEADVQKMGNSIVEQLATQHMGESGKTKLILKFNDPKKYYPAFMAIVYACMAHPDFASTFPGFQRRDAKKKLMVDDKGRPVYIDAIQWWIDWFMANCDVNIDGTVVTEDAKITVRK